MANPIVLIKVNYCKKETLMSLRDEWKKIFDKKAWLTNKMGVKQASVSEYARFVAGHLKADGEIKCVSSDAVDDLVMIVDDNIEISLPDLQKLEISECIIPENTVINNRYGYDGSLFYMSYFGIYNENTDNVSVNVDLKTCKSMEELGLISKKELSHLQEVFEIDSTDFIEGLFNDSRSNLDKKFDKDLKKINFEAFYASIEYGDHSLKYLNIEKNIVSTKIRMSVAKHTKIAEEHKKIQENASKKAKDVRELGLKKIAVIDKKIEIASRDNVTNKVMQPE